MSVDINVSVVNGEAVVKAIAPPVDVGVSMCSNASAYASNTTIVVYVPNCSIVRVRYITLSATTKSGSTWILSIDTPYRTIVMSSSNTIPIDMEPTPTPVSIGGLWRLEFFPERWSLST